MKTKQKKTVWTGQKTGRENNVQNLLGYQEISEMSGFAIQTLRQWKSSKNIPEPDFIIERVPIWKEATIKRWFTLRKQLTNRRNHPRKRAKAERASDHDVQDTDQDE